MDALNNMETSENDLKSFKSYIESERKDSDSDLYKAMVFNTLTIWICSFDARNGIGTYGN